MKEERHTRDGHSLAIGVECGVFHGLPLVAAKSSRWKEAESFRSASIVTSKGHISGKNSLHVHALHATLAREQKCLQGKPFTVWSFITAMKMAYLVYAQYSLSVSIFPASPQTRLLTFLGVGLCYLSELF